ncbi:MAG TPA: hypothetical protein P5136_01090 [Methanofastidiosum sp.]|nr:hypothetical protein [Methanofastidiosum sp.]
MNEPRRCYSCRHIDSCGYCSLYDLKRNPEESCINFKLPNKREWHYCLEPTAFDMRCDRCLGLGTKNPKDLSSGVGTNIWWSEYERLIWCYDCKIDTLGFAGIFTGPIPIHFASMITPFHRFNMITKEIEYCVLDVDDKGSITYMNEVDLAAYKLEKGLKKL